MSGRRGILKQRKAVGSIRHITKAMEMVATSRFRKVHSQAVAGRPYTDRLLSMVNDLASRGLMKRFRHPLLYAPDDIKRNALLIITSDRGLCAGYNSSVLRLAIERLEHLESSGCEVLLQVVGKRGSGFLRYHKRHIDKEYTDIGDVPQYELVMTLAGMLIDSFLAREIGGLEVAYMRFISTGNQQPAIAEILPLPRLEPRDETPAAGEDLEPPGEHEPSCSRCDFVPSPKELLASLLPATVRLRIYQCFLDAAVSEHAMRLAAMRAATDNADEMILDLKRRYNHMRQTQITTELAEIVGGRMPLE